MMSANRWPGYDRLFSSLSLQNAVEKDMPIFLTEGHWFVSFYNDYGDAQSVEMTAKPAREMTERFMLSPSVKLKRRQ